MIRISEETATALLAWAGEPGGIANGDIHIVDVIRNGIPRPEPKFEVCPACGKEPYTCEDDCVHCDCGVSGPRNDSDGIKWDAMARPARVLREIEEWARAGVNDKTDSTLYGCAMRAVLDFLEGKK